MKSKDEGINIKTRRRRRITRKNQNSSSETVNKDKFHEKAKNEMNLMIFSKKSINEIEINRFQEKLEENESKKIIKQKMR